MLTIQKSYVLTDGGWRAIFEISPILDRERFLRNIYNFR